MLKLGKDFLDDQATNYALSGSIMVEKTAAEKDSFWEQLKEFKNDNSYKERFKSCSLTSTYGIEMFMYSPNKHLKSSLKLIGADGLMGVDEVVEATHIAKIIKLPTNVIDELDYEEGQLVFLRVGDTVGTGPNPDFIFAQQFAQSNMDVKVDDPSKLERTSFKFVSKMYDNAFLPPNEYNKASDKITTYSVEKFRIIGSYEMD